MKSRDYFPLGVATGFAFCNRKEETNLLISNLKNTKHTLLMATRRYGKSSLALQSLKLSKFPYVEVDFYMASNEKNIESYILNGIGELIGKTLGPVDKLLNSLKKYAKTLNPKLSVGNSIFKLELTADFKTDPATNVKEGLMLLEKMLQEKKKHAVMLMDEFQIVGTIAQGKGIEAAIRHVAQKTKYLTFIFSGSNRKLLKTMFEDNNRPLYKLCWKIDVKRISAEHYDKHIQKAAKLSWKKEVSVEVLNKIYFFSERHPYYLNLLCDKLWTYCLETPTEKDVERAWHEIIEQEKSDAIKDISMLSFGQKKLLYQIAKNPVLQITSKDSMFELDMPSSSIIAALEGLEEKDVIEKLSNQFHIINPVIRYYVMSGSK